MSLSYLTAITLILSLLFHDVDVESVTLDIPLRITTNRLISNRIRVNLVDGYIFYIFRQQNVSQV